MRRPTDITDFSSPYGMRGDSFHDGCDYLTPMNTELFGSCNGGNLWQAAWDPTYGNFIIINHGSFQLLHAHLSKLPMLNIGDEINEGQSLGNITGNSGTGSGPHLHTEVRIGSVQDIWRKDPDEPTKFLTSIDPERFFNKDLTTEEILKVMTFQPEDWIKFESDHKNISNKRAVNSDELAHCVKMGNNVGDLIKKLFRSI